MTSGQRFRPLVWVLAVLALFLSFSAWAVSSPIGSNPDGDYHLANIYCTTSYPDCGSDQLAIWRGQEPANERYPACFPEIAGGQQCADAARAHVPPLGYANLSYYPSLRYRLLALLGGDTVGETSLRIRLANAVLGSVMIVASILLSGALWWRAAALMWMVFLVPYGLTLIPSANPSGWLYLGVGSLIGPLSSHVAQEKPTRLRAIVAVIFCVAAAMIALGSRNEAPFYIFAAALLAMIAPPRRPQARRLVLPGGIAVTSVVVLLSRRWDVIALPLGSELVALIGCATLAIFALFWWFGYRSPSPWVLRCSVLVTVAVILGAVALRSELDQFLVTQGYLPLGGVMHNLGLAWSVPLSAVGFPLQVPGLPAILAAPLPATALAAAGISFVLAASYGLLRMDWARLRALGVALAIGVGYPLVVAMTSATEIDEPASVTQFQARYFAAGALLILFTLLVQRSNGPHEPKFLTPMLALLTSYASAAVLATYLSYYSLAWRPGTTWVVGLLEMTAPPWWWVPAVSPSGVWVVGAASFAVFGACVSYAARREHGTAAPSDRHPNPCHVASGPPQPFTAGVGKPR